VRPKASCGDLTLECVDAVWAEGFLVSTVFSKSYARCLHGIPCLGQRFSSDDTVIFAAGIPNAAVAASTQYYSSTLTHLYYMPTIDCDAVLEY
jgi:hypothetical protein